MGSIFNAGTNRQQGADHTLPEPQRLHYCAEGMLSHACQAHTPLCNSGLWTGPSKMFKKYSLLVGFICFMSFSTQIKRWPHITVYLDIPPVSCISVCSSPLESNMDISHQSLCTESNESWMQNIMAMYDSLNTEPEWLGLEHHSTVLA